MGFIPPVDAQGWICYTDTEGLILERHRPVAVVEEAFQRVVGLLADLVPADPFYHPVERILDLAFMREFVACRVRN